MDLARHPRAFLFPNTLQASGELVQLFERALQLLFGSLSLRDIFTYANRRTIRQFDHGPSCINRLPTPGSGFQFEPLSPCACSEIQDRLAVPQVGITFGNDID